MRWEGDEDKNEQENNMAPGHGQTLILRNKDRKYWKWMDFNSQSKMRL
jgi:hypothetical protein